jgi:fucose 4-O-acetylase-like acetyltransferase
VFYYLGFLSKKSWETRTGYMESFSYAIVYGIAFFACLHVFHYKGLNLAYSVYDRSLLLVVLCAGLGIGMTANLSKLVSNNRFLEFLGRNSLLIFGTHLVVMRVVIFLFSKIQTLTIVELKEDLLQSLLISATTLLLVMFLLFMQHFIIKTQK